jgi:hypothetical protein
MAPERRIWSLGGIIARISDQWVLSLLSMREPHCQAIMKYVMDLALKIASKITFLVPGSLLDSCQDYRM